MQSKLKFITLIVSLWITLIPSAALAHSGTEIGPYLVVIGWENEPAIVGERNAVVIEVTENAIPVEGLADSLELSVVYAGRVFLGNLEPTATLGLYRVEILPTVRGQYDVQLTGSIKEVAVDALLEPEEVLSADILQFPEKPPDNLDLQVTVEYLSARLRMVTVLAIVGIVVGVLGLGAAVLTFVRKERP